MISQVPNWEGDETEHRIQRLLPPCCNMFDQYISNADDQKKLIDFIKSSNPSSHAGEGVLLVFRGKGENGKTTMFKALNEALVERTNHLRRVEKLIDDEPDTFHPIALQDGAVYGCELHTDELPNASILEDGEIRRRTIHILFDHSFRGKRRPIWKVVKELKEYILSLME